MKTTFLIYHMIKNGCGNAIVEKAFIKKDKKYMVVMVGVAIAMKR